MLLFHKHSILSELNMHEMGMKKYVLEIYSCPLFFVFKTNFVTLYIELKNVLVCCLSQVMNYSRTFIS